MTHIPIITDLSAVFCDLEHQLSAEIGFRLFSVLLVDLPDVVRIHSSNLEAYPLGGRKHMGPTPWGTHVITRGEPWLGQTPEEMRNAFSDYDLIADLGCGCCLNIPVRDHGQTIGTLNLLDVQGRYGTDHLRRATKFGDPCVPLLKTAGKLWKIASNHRETLYE